MDCSCGNTARSPSHLRMTRPRKQLSFLFPYIHQHLPIYLAAARGAGGQPPLRDWGRPPALPGEACELVGIAFTWGPIQGKKDQDVRPNVSLMGRSHESIWRCLKGALHLRSPGRAEPGDPPAESEHRPCWGPRQLLLCPSLPFLSQAFPSAQGWSLSVFPGNDPWRLPPCETLRTPSALHLGFCPPIRPNTCDGVQR